MKLTKWLLAAALVTTASVVHAAEEQKAAPEPAPTVIETKAEPAKPQKAKANPAGHEKLRKEYKEVRKNEYLKNIENREKYHSAMAAEMQAIIKACAGTDEVACKAAKSHEKATREKFKESREANSQRFKNKMQEYRNKLGNAAPTAVEKEHKALNGELAPKAAAPTAAAAPAVAVPTTAQH